MTHIRDSRQHGFTSSHKPRGRFALNEQKQTLQQMDLQMMQELIYARPYSDETSKLDLRITQSFVVCEVSFSQPSSISHHVSSKSKKHMHTNNQQIYFDTCLMEDCGHIECAQFRYSSKTYGMHSLTMSDKSCKTVWPMRNEQKHISRLLN